GTFRTSWTVTHRADLVARNGSLCCAQSISEEDLVAKLNAKTLALIIGVLFVPLILVGCASNEESGETRIFEIENTEEVFGKKEEEDVTVRKHYMILNPPEDLIELKELVEKYGKEHPVEGEIQVTEGKTRFFHMHFYRESDDLPRNWQPDEGYLSTDRLEHHKNDLIAAINWSDADPQKEYYSYDKSKEGKIIKRMRFVGNRLVE
ncbi:hypothetical protein V6U90_12300, partial [Micromonospora sp. CPCC 206060]|uniref:hypothetical protein n=1 Tax=Micromonospora sp. CPCC 206060 TaxID=3122406 RepID=UPI002FEEC2CC